MKKQQFPARERLPKFRTTTMRLFAFALCLVGSVLASREATAQDFWYVPPGYGYGYTYGLDFGGGVGYGYGAAVGVPVSPQALMGSYTPAYIPPRDFGDSFSAYPPANVYGTYSKPHPVKKAVATASPKKKKAGKVQPTKVSS